MNLQQGARPLVSFDVGLDGTSQLQESSPARLKDGFPELRIFLAEDNRADAYLVELALTEEQLSFQLQQVTDGEEALHVVERFGTTQAPPHIALLDLNLPRQEGDAVLRTLRAHPSCSRLPIVIMTSSESMRDRDTARQFDAVFFPKPSDLDGFLRLGKIVRGLCMNEAAEVQPPPQPSC